MHPPAGSKLANSQRSPTECTKLRGRIGARIKCFSLAEGVPEFAANQNDRAAVLTEVRLTAGSRIGRRAVLFISVNVRVRLQGCAVLGDSKSQFRIRFQSTAANFFCESLVVALVLICVTLGEVGQSLVDRLA